VAQKDSIPTIMYQMPPDTPSEGWTKAKAIELPLLAFIMVKKR
jgi:hypothetical protein